MRRFLIGISLLAMAIPALAVRVTPRQGDRITVLNPRAAHSYPFDRSVRGYVPNYLRDEFRRSGYHTEMLDMTIDEIQTGQRALRHPADFYVEVVWSDADGGDIVEAGGGGAVGNTNVGAGVAVVYAHAAAEMRIYDGRSLELVDTFHLQSTRVGPDLDGVGFYWQSIYIALPIRTNFPFRAAARDLARQATVRLREVASPADRLQR